MTAPRPAPLMDFTRLVNSVADEFERDSGVQVLLAARTALAQPAIEHARQLMEELEDGKITVPFLRSAVREVIENAHAIAIEEEVEHITVEVTLESMRRKCPYVPWC